MAERAVAHVCHAGALGLFLKLLDIRPQVVQSARDFTIFLYTSLGINPCKIKHLKSTITYNNDISICYQTV